MLDCWQKKDAENDDEQITKASRKKQQRSGNTLEKSATALNIKKFDLEFAVDPLFKKTCEDIDEGGASGLLLNHLNIYKGGKIVFDSGDIEATVHFPCDSEISVQFPCEIHVSVKFWFEIDA